MGITWADVQVRYNIRERRAVIKVYIYCYISPQQYCPVGSALKQFSWPMNTTFDDFVGGVNRYAEILKIWYSGDPCLCEKTEKARPCHEEGYREAKRAESKKDIFPEGSASPEWTPGSPKLPDPGSLEPPYPDAKNMSLSDAIGEVLLNPPPVPYGPGGGYLAPMRFTPPVRFAF